MTTPTPNDSTPPKDNHHHRYRRRHRSSSSSSSSSTSSSTSPPPRLNFYNYFPTKPPLPLPLPNPLNSILSPRRSSRLLEKHGATFSTTTKVLVTATSDYGTMSNATNVDPVLSDEVSILSLDDLTQSASTSQANENNVTLKKTGEGIYMLIPKPKPTYNFRRKYSPSVSVKMLQPLSQVELQNMFQIHNPTNQRINVTSTAHHNHQEGYDFSLFPLLVIPLHPSFKSYPVYIYLIHDGDEDPSPNVNVQQFQLGYPRNGYVSFHVEKPGEYLLFPRLPPITVREQLVPVHQLVLQVEDPMHIAVEFPANCFNYGLLVQMDVHPDNYIDTDFFVENSTPAAPVFRLSPNSVSFQLPVKILVELKDGDDILKRFPQVRLKIFQCRELEREELSFELELRGSKMYAVFFVTRFSFFRAVWTTLGSILSSANVGLCQIFSGKSSSSWMKCQATMDQYENDRFGLEVSVYKADRKVPEVRAYSHVVGKTQSKFLKHGRLQVRLKSELFEANLEAGEEKGLVKDEDFWGQDFSVQFSLRFKGSIERGPFGKVLVKHSDNIIFEFNIQKQGNEAETKEQSNNEEIEDCQNFLDPNNTSLHELATVLFITDGNNWKLLAKHLHFTKHEIKTKFKPKTDPFSAIIKCYKSRGGTSDEFIKCLYEVHREMKFNSVSGSPLTCPADSMSTRISNSKSSGLGSSINRPFERIDSSSSSSSSDGDYSKDKKKKKSKQNPVGTPSPSTAEGDSVKKPQKRKPSKRKRNTRKRRKSSKEPASTSSSSSSSSDTDKAEVVSGRNSSKHSDFLRSSTLILAPGQMWDFSTHLTNNNWKALGRTLQLDESILINIEQVHKASGNRECYYQVLLSWKESYPSKCTFGVLYQALVKENMVDIAKKMKMLF